MYPEKYDKDWDPIGLLLVLITILLSILLILIVQTPNLQGFEEEIIYSNDTLHSENKNVSLKSITADNQELVLEIERLKYELGVKEKQLAEIEYIKDYYYSIVFENVTIIKTFTNTKPIITVNVGRNEIKEYCSLFNETAACAYINTTHCDMYLPEIKTRDDLNSWGHELAHCVYGSWH